MLTTNLFKSGGAGDFHSAFVKRLSSLVVGCLMSASKNSSAQLTQMLTGLLLLRYSMSGCVASPLWCHQTLGNVG